MRKLVHGVVLLCLLLAGGFGVWSAIGLNRPEQVALTILLAAAYLWVTEAIPLFTTSLVIVLLAQGWLMPTLTQSGVVVEKDAFLAPFASDLIFLFLGGFVLSAGLHRFGYDERMARFILRRCGPSVPALTLGILGVTGFLSMWLSNTATAAMMLSLVLPLCRRLPVGDPGRKALLLAVPLGANIGGLGTPIGSPPNAIAMGYLNSIGSDISFLKWMAIGLPGVIGVLALGWFLLNRIFRTTARLVDEPEPAAHGPWTFKGILILAGALLAAAGWMTGAWHGFSAGTVAVIPMVLYFGSGALPREEIKKLSWDVLLLMGGGLCLGSILTVSGLADRIVASLPVDGISPYVLMVGFGLLAVVMSSVMSNTATANLIMPILLGVSAVRPEILMLAVAFSCSMSMPLPVSTPPNAMAFSTGELSVKDLLKIGLVVTIAGFVLAMTTGYWWWGKVGLY